MNASLSIFFGLLAMFSWGTGDFFGAISSRKIGFLKAYFWMRLFGTALVSLYLFKTKEQLSLSLVFVLLLFFSALFEFMATMSFLKGFTVGSISVVSPIASSWSVITVILSIIFFREILSGFALLAIFLIILGLWLIGADIEMLLGKKRFNFAKGGKEGLIAMFCWGLMAFLFILPSRMVQGWYLPIMILRIFTILITLIFALAFKKSFILQKKDFPVLKFILPHGLCDALGFFALNFGSLIGQASIVSPISSAFSVVTVILGLLFLKEKIFANQIFGIISVISGIVLLSV